MNYQDKSLSALKLGQNTEYKSQYDASLLQPVPRRLNREGLRMYGLAMNSHG